jgi:hypothetical protein
MATGAFEEGAFRVALTAATDTTGGGVLSLANPEGVDLYITRVILNVSTQSTGAAAVDVGIAADGTTSNDSLIDGLSVATAGVFDNVKNGGTNGKAGQKLGAAQYITATASATTAGMVGEAIIQWVRL